MIQRYDDDHLPHPDGCWVFHKDHERDLAALQRRVEEMEGKLDRLKGRLEQVESQLTFANKAHTACYKEKERLANGIWALLATPESENEAVERGWREPLRALLESKS